MTTGPETLPVIGTNRSYQENSASIMQSASLDISSERETNPANMDAQQPQVDGQSSQESKTAIIDNTAITNEGNDDSQAKSDQRNDSSVSATAFTISFEDEHTPNPKKLFGIRDSIRKFAPPKPHTIEKPRPSKEDAASQDNSYMSIESAPGGLSKHSSRFDPNNSFRSSCRRSDSSKSSNISESAAFLIGKMLDVKQNTSVSSACSGLDERSMQRYPTTKKSTPAKKFPLPSESTLDDELDFSEDKSDNGTYIVGADPESDAARKKIDELFGVVKAAEASLKASSSARADRVMATKQNAARKSRAPDKRPLSRERQEHIARLATGRNSSRSSSSSRPENLSLQTEHRPRSATRQVSASKTQCNRPRRAASQSSRHSSNRDNSDVDTRSSRSSFHNDLDFAGHESLPQTNVTSMKFNRAFALRRARLGLGEPTAAATTRLSSTSATISAQQSSSMESELQSPKRGIPAATSNLRAGSTQPPPASSSQNLSRNDGGRFSLRMKNRVIPSSRLYSGHQTKAPNQTVLIDSYLSKISASKASYVGHSSSLTKPSQQLGYYSHSSMPYQSGDELEMTSPSRQKSVMNTSTFQRKAPTHEFESDSDLCGKRFNYSLNAEHYVPHYNHSESRATVGGSSSSKGKQLGALDSLVISAISSLSLKIRGSVCDLMVDHAKRLPMDNEIRLVVEEILPQLTASSSRPKSPTSIEEIDQSLYFDLAQTLKNLKKVEQMVDVMKNISSQISTLSPTTSLHGSNSKSSDQLVASTYKTGEGSNTNSETNSLSPV